MGKHLSGYGFPGSLCATQGTAAVSTLLGIVLLDVRVECHAAGCERQSASVPARRGFSGTSPTDPLLG